MPTLEGRKAIVSGAARGLGEAFARRLAAEGVSVLLVDVLPAVDEVAADIASQSRVAVTSLKADVSKRVDVEAVVAAAAAEQGGVDVLVNNAGRWRSTPVDQSWAEALEDWTRVMDSNLKGLLMLSRACVPAMRARGGGHIVHVSSEDVLPALDAGCNAPDLDIYNASKWAINGFTDAWSKHLARDNIRVNALCIGATDTPMLRSRFEGRRLPADLAPRVLRPEQIAQLLIDLLEDGRSGENIGAWPGQPVALGPVKPAHRRITG